jgi:DNA-3-methyladenine glycosylase II
LEKATAHLIATDPRFASLIVKHPCPLFTPSSTTTNPFASLCSSIISQQVSGAAAASIKRKFIALFNSDDTFPTPAQVLEKPMTELRAAGLSGRKAEYITGLAEKFVSGELTDRELVEGEWEDVERKLIAVRGLGRWSVEMFGVFALGRGDLLSTGDLGVQ